MIGARKTVILLHFLQLLTPPVIPLQHDLFVEEILQTTYPSKLNEVIVQLNNSLLKHVGQDVVLKTKSLDQTYSTFRKWSFYRGINNSYTSNKTSFLISCHSCHRLKPLSVDCPILCYDSLTMDWTSCDQYRERITSYNSLIDQLVCPSKQVVMFYDLEREGTLLPVHNTLISDLKMVHWDTSYINCNKSDQVCKLPLQSHNMNTISNFIISTKLNWKHIIHQKRNYINALGPENNWLIIDRYNNSNSQGIKDILKPFTQGGNYITIISDMTKYKSLEELVKYHVIEGCRANKTQRKYQQNIKLRTSNVDVKECIVPNPVSSSKVCKHTSSKGQKSWKLNSLFPIKFHGFHGRTFSVATKTYSPFVTRVTDEHGASNYSGLVIELLDALAQSLNFSYNLTEVPDGKFGICKNWTGKCVNNQWNGLIGMLQRKEVDIAASGLTIDAKRETVVDFTFPFWEEPSAVLVRRTMDGPALLWVFKPLHLYVWISIVAAIIIMSLILWFFARLESYILAVRDPMYTFVHSFWYMFGAFLQQGGHYQPKTNAGQMVASMWWIVIVIIYGIYTGNLIAFLSVTKVTLPFNTLQQMASQSEFTYGIEDGFVQVMVFKSADSGVYHDIWKGIESHPGSLVPDTKTGIHKVKTEKYALISDKTYLQTFSVTDCNLHLIKQEFFKVGFGLAVQEGWPYKKYFDNAILKLVEAGFIERWQQKHFPQDKCGSKMKTVKSKSISIGDMSGNFCTLILGLALSALVLLAEICVQKIKGIKRYNCNPTLPVTESTSTVLQQSISTDNVLFLKSSSESQILGFKSARTYSKEMTVLSDIDGITDIPNINFNHRSASRNNTINRIKRNSIIIQDTKTVFDINTDDKIPNNTTASKANGNLHFHIDSFLFKPHRPLLVLRRSSRRKNAYVKPKSEEKTNETELSHVTRQTNTVYKTYRPKSPLELL